MKRASSLHIRQQGAVLLALMLVVVVSGSAYFLTASNNRMDIKDSQRQDVLYQLQAAKQALLAYAAKSYKLHGDRGYGFLPCPDLKDNTTNANTPDGLADTTCNVNSRLGWLPQTVTVADGTYEVPNPSGSIDEQLWYAVSTNVMHSSSSNDSKRRSSSEATATPNFLTLDSRSDYVALIIAPGEALGAQDHTASQTDYTQYLDGNNGANNVYTRFGDSESFNDMIVGITHDEYMKVIGPAIAQDFRTAALAGSFPRNRLDLFWSVYDASEPVPPPATSVLPAFYHYYSTVPRPEYWALWVYYQNMVTYNNSGGDESITFAFNECDNMLFTFSRDNQTISRTGDTCL